MRKWLTALLAAAMLLAAAPPVRAAGPDIAAPSAILMDAATGTVLYEKNASERLRPASVTKVMTLLLVMEALDTGRIGWDDTVIASEAACAKGGSQVYLEPGEEMSMDEMLKSVVVSSANDCATALAEHVAGSESAFVGMMNQRAGAGPARYEFRQLHGAGRCAGGRGAPDDGARHRRDLAGASEARPHPRLHDHLDGHGARRQIRPFEHE